MLLQPHVDKLHSSCSSSNSSRKPPPPLCVRFIVGMKRGREAFHCFLVEFRFRRTPCSPCFYSSRRDRQSLHLMIAHSTAFPTNRVSAMFVVSIAVPLHLSLLIRIQSTHPAHESIRLHRRLLLARAALASVWCECVRRFRFVALTPICTDRACRTCGRSL